MGSITLQFLFRVGYICCIPAILSGTYEAFITQRKNHRLPVSYIWATSRPSWGRDAMLEGSRMAPEHRQTYTLLFISFSF